MHMLPSTLRDHASPSALPAHPSPQRPTYLESQIRQVVGGGSVKDHLLTQVGLGRGQEVGPVPWWSWAPMGPESCWLLLDSAWPTGRDRRRVVRAAECAEHARVVNTTCKPQPHHEACAPRGNCNIPAHSSAAHGIISRPHACAVPEGSECGGGRPVWAQAVQARQGWGAQPGTVQGCGGWGPMRAGLPRLLVTSAPDFAAGCELAFA